MKRLKKFTAISWREKLLFAEALLLQLFVGLLLKVIPFRWIPRLFANPVILNPTPARLTHDEIKRATQRAGAVSPWKNRCLVQSLAARLMLRRRKILSKLSLGMAKDGNGNLTAHAWITTGDQEIVEKSGEYTVLYLF